MQIEERRAEAVLAAVEDNRNELAWLAERLIAIPSPNPPGDVRQAMAFAASYFQDRGIPIRRYMPASGLENLVVMVEGAAPGPHVVLNAHLDVFPVEAPATGRVGPTRTGFDGSVVWGRGAVDMKGGAAVFMLVTRLLWDLRRELHGKVTLCLVCDEETMGRYGSKYLLEHVPDVRGDVLLSTEPSSLGVVRYGEKGFIFGQAVFEGAPAHAAYPGSMENCIARMARFTLDLQDLVAGLEPAPQGQVSSGLDAVLGRQADEWLSRPVLNFGRVEGGIKVNMQPRVCRLDVDIRLPIGLSSAEVAQMVASLAERHGGRYEVWESRDASTSDTSHWLFGTLCDAVERVTGTRPKLGVGLGATDCRLWRARGIPAAVFGPDPTTMGRDDEHVPLDDLVTVARAYALTCAAALTPVASHV